MHISDELRCVLFEKVPLGHGCGLLVAGGQKCPTGHGPAVPVLLMPSGVGELEPAVQ